MNFSAVRDYIFIIDEEDLKNINWHNVGLIIDELSNNGVNIKIKIPEEGSAFISSISSLNFANYVSIISNFNFDKIAPLNLQKQFRKQYIIDFMGENEEAKRVNRLLLLAKKYAADSLISSKQILLEWRYRLLASPEYLRVIEPTELIDILLVIRHGHNIFPIGEYSSSPNIYYCINNDTMKIYLEKQTQISQLIQSQDIKELLRNAILNRLTAIFHTRDLLTFYELQHDHRNKTSTESFPSYYYFEYFHNYYMFLIWGLLEQLSFTIGIALKLNPRKCGIKNKDFLKAIKQKRRDLYEYLTSNEIDNWVSRISHIRHPAAHKRFPQISTVYDQESVSFKMSTEDVTNQILIENPEYQTYPQGIAERILNNEVSTWRIKNADIMFVKAGFVPEENYYYQPTIDVDYNLKMLLGVVDMFLKILPDILSR